MIRFLLFTAAAICLLLSLRGFARARLLASVPTAKVRSAPQGYVRLDGRAQPLSPVPMRAPVVGVPCVWFDYEFVEGNGDDAARRYHRSTRSFLLEDESGSCRIDPRAMRIEPRSIRRRPPLSLGPVVPAGLVSLRWIAVGEEIAAYGNFSSMRADFASQKDDLVRAELAALKRDREALLQFDANGDGVVDGDEWEAARTAVIAGVDAHLREQQRRWEGRELGHVMRPPGDARLPFLVTAWRKLRSVNRQRLVAAMALLACLTLLLAAVHDPFVGWLDHLLERGLAAPL